MRGLNIMLRELLACNANMVILCIKLLMLNMLTFSDYLAIYGILADAVNNAPLCSAKHLRISSLPVEFGTGDKTSQNIQSSSRVWNWRPPDYKEATRILLHCTQ
jgi:hypothetical protein